MGANMKKTAGCLAAALLATSAYGYQMKPFKDVHERMTIASVFCSNNPSDCTEDLSQATAPSEVEYYLEGLRWNDDPVHQLKGLNELRYLELFGRCVPQAKLAPLAEKSGLLCRSHYGDWQFIHSMAIDTNETIDATHEKIMIWAEFTFKVSTGVISPSIEVAAVPVKGFPELFAPQGSLMNEQKWDVSTLFSMFCNHPFTCTKIRRKTPKDPDVADRRIRQMAMGALLHTIQDSFSKAHAFRAGDGVKIEKGVPQPTISCGAIQKFYAYQVQDSIKHRAADGFPSLDSSCQNVAGPVKWGATVISWSKANKSWEDVAESFRQQIFSIDTTNAPSNDAFNSDSSPNGK
jgi:hypothetical protein